LIYVTQSQIFTTSQGLDGMDAACEHEKPAGAGAVKALLATTTSPAIARMSMTALYVRPDGAIVGTAQDIANGTILSAPWVLATGAYQPMAWGVWTGARAADIPASATEN